MEDISDLNKQTKSFVQGRLGTPIVRRESHLNESMKTFQTSTSKTFSFGLFAWVVDRKKDDSLVRCGTDKNSLRLIRALWTYTVLQLLTNPTHMRLYCAVSSSCYCACVITKLLRNKLN